MNLLVEKYKGLVSAEHRKYFGQFYTLPKVAEFMCSWVVSKSPEEIYDPAFGLGVFYDVAKSGGFKGRFLASELDGETYAFYKANNPHSEALLKHEDYFSRWDDKFDAIICNPPYSKFQNFPNKDLVLDNLYTATGVKLLGYTNSASAFLVKSVHELNEHGRLAYIMPLEFLNAGYGCAVKDFLLKSGSIENIIQIEDESASFSDALTTVCIVLFEKGKHGQHVTFSVVNSLDDFAVKEVCKVECKEIRAEDKWLQYFMGDTGQAALSKEFVPLSIYGNFKRGIATGANEFFCLKKSQIVALGLPEDEYSYCITKSNQIRGSYFDDAHLLKLAEENAEVFLFNVVDNESISEAAASYIRFGEARGFHKRYLTRVRSLWYMLEHREPAPILFGVFSRGKYKIIRNMSSAINLTCYHGFVPNALGAGIVDKLFIFLKSHLGDVSLTANKRIYGKQLNKFEPNDLNGVKVPSMEQFNLLSDEFVACQLQVIFQTGHLTQAGEDFLRKVFKY